MKFDRILLDTETQRDFFEPGGSCYRRPASDVAKQIYKLFSWARSSRIPVLSTALRVRRGEIGPLAKLPHCIDNTEGERKLSRTLLPRRINLGLRNITDLPREIFRHYQQVIFEKRATDIFTHTRIERLITELEADNFIICGAGLAKGIVEAAVGLRARGFGVIVAQDAVLDLDDPLTEMAYLRMEAKGVIFAPTAKIIVPIRRRSIRRLRTWAQAAN